MRQSLNKLILKVETFSQNLENKGHALVQQAISSPHFLVLQCRLPGITYFLYIGRGSSYQGFDYSPLKIPATLRVQDRFLQYARHNWKGLRILGCEASSIDRVLIFKGIKNSILQEIYFFWRGRDLFFADVKYGDREIEVFRSWEGKAIFPPLEEGIDIAQIFNGLSYGEATLGRGESDINISSYLEKENQEDGGNIQSVSKKYKKRRETIRKMESELLLLKNVEGLRTYTQKNLEDIEEVGRGRFKISFRGIEGHFKKREYLFDKIKSWKRSRELLSQRLDALKNYSEKGKEKNKKLGEQKIIRPIWKYEKIKSSIQSHINYIKLIYQGRTCYMGRTAIENDYIRKTFGKKDDLWIHLEGYKSGHLIVKDHKKPLEIEDFRVLSSALVELGGMKIQDIPIIYTQVKNVKGVKGTVGMVTYKKEKHLKVIFDKKWKEKLKLGP